MTQEEPRTPSLVSVIVPVHNGDRFLAAALENILQQDYPVVEVIVVDDGSTDDTARIASAFDDRVRYTYQAHAGPAAARNLGIEAARGRFIAFLDVDDVWPQGKLRRQVAQMEAHPEVDIVQGLIVQMEIDPDSPSDNPVFEECSEPYQFVNVGSALFRSEVFDRVGLFDEALTENEDADWFLRAWENDVPKVVQDHVELHYRKHGENMTLQQVPPGLRMVRLFKRHLDRSREQQSSNGADAPRRVNIAAYIGGPPLDRRRRLVQNPRFSVISNDCWGGGLYNHLSLMYRTPFVGVRVLAPCFIELLKDLGGHLRAPLEFVGTSRYDFMNERRARFLGFYPIALLRGSVEIHFVHEPDEETAAQNWKRRLAKMHWDNVFVKFSQDPEVCTDALLEEFDRLEYAYKVCFTLREYPGLGSGVAMPEYFEDGAPMYFLSRRFFDSISWLNKEHGPNTQAYRTGAPEGAVRAT